MSPKSTGYVYFIRSRRTRSIKIGFCSVHPDRRLVAIQSACPAPLERFGYIRGDMDFERKLHWQFKHLRESGEWFRADRELTAFIRKKSKPWLSRYDEELQAKRREPGYELHQKMLADPQLAWAFYRSTGGKKGWLPKGVTDEN